MSTEQSLPAASPQGGFALALVVLLLFAISVLGAAGYQAVKGEFFQSQQSGETGQALAIAEAGLAWYIGVQRGVVADTTEHSINGGTAVVITRKVRTVSDEEDLYLVTSEGTYTDPRYPQIPAVRKVSQYTTYKKIPMNTMAPLMTTSSRVRVDRDGEVDGRDYASFGDCAGAPASTIAGVVARGNIQDRDGDNITGSPEGMNLNSFDNVVDSVGVAWDIYSDTDFPVDRESLPGYFWFLTRPDTFPVIRIDGNLSPRHWNHSGRGVLIITGELRSRRNGRWRWNGIVIAGDVQDLDDNNNMTIRGALVAGMGSEMGNLDIDEGEIYYNSCYVAAAGAALAHMEPVTNSFWEVG